MVDYERGLGDLGFRHTKEREQGRRLGQEGCPNSATWQTLGGGGDNGGGRRLGLGFWWREVCPRGGTPAPSFIGGSAPAKWRESSPKSASLAGGWRERNSSPSRFPPLPPPNKIAV